MLNLIAEIYAFCYKLFLHKSGNYNYCTLQLY